MAESQTDTPAQGSDAPPQNPPAEPPAQEPDLATEVERLKGELAKARKWEDRAKANKAAAEELEKVKAESMSDMEKAIAQARQEATAEAAKGFGARLVDAEVKAAAAGRQVDVDALLEGLDRTRFLSDDGEPDQAAIAAWVDRIAPESTPSPDGVAVIDLGQGNRGQTVSTSDPLLDALTSVVGVSNRR